MKLLTVFAAILAVSFAQDKITEQFEAFFKNGGRKGLEPRITGGATAMPNEFPYQVGLLLLSEVSNGFLTKKVYNWCGGSIINNNYVLTAAHCLHPALAGAVILGAHNIQTPEINRKTIMVDRSHFMVHSNYDPYHNSNDIALIKLPQAIAFNPAIQPVQLPAADLDDSKLVGRLATATGWGRTGDNTPTPASLQFANLKILNSKTCEKVYNQYATLFLQSNLCVDGNEKKSVCPGDSGGPLVINNSDGTATIVGITSYGHRNGCEKGIPTAFTRVTSYLDWINSNTGS